MWKASWHFMYRMPGLPWRRQEQQTWVGQFIWNRLVIETGFFSSPQIILLLLILFVDLAYMILKPGRPTSPIKSALDHVVHTTFSKKEPYFKWMVGSYAKVQIAACLVSSAGNIPQCCKARRRRSSFKSKCVLIGRASGCLCRWRLLRCLKDSM